MRKQSPSFSSDHTQNYSQRQNGRIGAMMSLLGLAINLHDALPVIP